MSLFLTSDPTTHQHPSRLSVVMAHFNSLHNIPRRRFWLEFTVMTDEEIMAEGNTDAIVRAARAARRAQAAKAAKGPAGFPQFPRLPAEIRLQIWELALLHPRIIAITCRSEDYIPQQPVTYMANLGMDANSMDYSQGPTSVTLPSLASSETMAAPEWKPPAAELPALFVVCRESYSVACKFYQRAFNWRVPLVLVDDDDDVELNAAIERNFARNFFGFHGLQGQPIPAPAAQATEVVEHAQPVGAANGGQGLSTGAAAAATATTPATGADTFLPPLSSVLGQQSQTALPSQRRAGRRRPGGPGCWFNFQWDSVLLRGDLEPAQEAAATSMVYFLPRHDTVRVRQVACNAADLGVGELLANQLYARLFPIIDRFGIKDRLVVVDPQEAGIMIEQMDQEMAAAIAEEQAQIPHTTIETLAPLLARVPAAGQAPMPDEAATAAAAADPGAPQQHIHVFLSTNGGMSAFVRPGRTSRRRRSNSEDADIALVQQSVTREEAARDAAAAAAEAAVAAEAVAAAEAHKWSVTEASFAAADHEPYTNTNTSPGRLSGQNLGSVDNGEGSSRAWSGVARSSALAAQEDDDMNGLGAYDISNNICQQVWERWTKSQNMPLLTQEHGAEVEEEQGEEEEEETDEDEEGGEEDVDDAGDGGSEAMHLDNPSAPAAFVNEYGPDEAEDARLRAAQAAAEEQARIDQANDPHGDRFEVLPHPDTIIEGADLTDIQGPNTVSVTGSSTCIDDMQIVMVGADRLAKTLADFRR